jgi:hypothetical protein
VHRCVSCLTAGVLLCGAAAAQTPKPYVPEPRPAKTEYLVGAHYFPGWKEGTHFVPWPGESQAWGWYKIVPFPNRTPLLGYYDEGSPEVADWEIKWALEHGISYFVYCWYRQRDNVGKPISVETLRLGHAIHEGFFHARYRDRFRFAIMWENNNGGGVTSADELVNNLAPFWIEQYFKHPSYLKIGNRPVLYIYQIRRLMEDLGTTEQVRAALTRLRETVRKAGFDGLILMGAPHDTNPDVLRRVRDCGFDSLFAYGWEPREQHPTTAQSVERQVSATEAWRDSGLLPFVPTATMGRDRIPWSRDHPSTPALHPDRLKRWVLSPEQYQGLLTRLKGIMDALPASSPGRRMILLDAWNEWGEGHHIAPHTGAGFGYLKGVREVFTSQDNRPEYRSPYEFGLGPYDSRHKARWAK